MNSRIAGVTKPSSVNPGSLTSACRTFCWVTGLSLANERNRSNQWRASACTSGESGALR